MTPGRGSHSDKFQFAVAGNWYTVAENIIRFARFPATFK